MFGVLVAILTAALQPREFTATGAIVNPQSPSEPAIPAKQQRAEEQRPEEAVGLILKGLGSLVGENSIKDGHVHIRVRALNRPDNPIYMDIAIFVDIG